jgi:hypothetical protein
MNGWHISQVSTVSVESTDFFIPDTDACLTLRVFEGAEDSIGVRDEAHRQDIDVFRTVASAKLGAAHQVDRRLFVFFEGTIRSAVAGVVTVLRSAEVFFECEPEFIHLFCGVGVDFTHTQAFNLDVCLEKEAFPFKDTRQSRFKELL